MPSIIPQDQTAAGGLTLNSFGEDQVRVGMGQMLRVCIWFRVRLSQVSQIGAAFRGDFLSNAAGGGAAAGKNGIVLDGRVRDIFSAAVITLFICCSICIFHQGGDSHSAGAISGYFQSRPVFFCLTPEGTMERDIINSARR